MSSPIRAGDHEISDKRAPAMGEHNFEILTDIGLSLTEIDGLKSEGVL